MFEQASAPAQRNVIGDWVLRGGIGLFFVSAGAEKFTPVWVQLFQEIGLGQWFRYFTGVVEILGGILVLIPWTVTIGLALLGCTMASAALILIFVVGHPADSVVSGGIFIALTFFWWNRREKYA
jgi:putative oxidoreductase